MFFVYMPAVFPKAFLVHWDECYPTLYLSLSHGTESTSKSDSQNWVICQVFQSKHWTCDSENIHVVVTSAQYEHNKLQHNHSISLVWVLYATKKWHMCHKKWQMCQAKCHMRHDSDQRLRLISRSSFKVRYPSIGTQYMCRIKKSRNKTIS